MYVNTRPVPPRAAELLDLALAYVSAGIRVFPLHPVIAPGTADVQCACRAGRACPDIGKHPAVIWGSKASARTERSVRLLFEAIPNGGIGLVCGEVFDVLDIDGSAGQANEQQALEKLGHPTVLGTAYTGRVDGGRHLYLPRGTIAQTGTRLFGMHGIDGRARGGFVVAPGSRHRSGSVYAWATPIHEVLANISRYKNASRPGFSSSNETLQAATTVVVGRTRQQKLRAWSVKRLAAYCEALAAMEDGQRHKLSRDVSLAAGSMVLALAQEGVEVGRDEVQSALVGAAMKGGMGQREATRMIGQGLAFAYLPMPLPRLSETTADVALTIETFRRHGPALLATTTVTKGDGKATAPRKTTRDIADKLIEAIADRAHANGNLTVRLPRRDVELLALCSNTAAARAIDLLLTAELLSPVRSGSRRTGTGAEYRICPVDQDRLDALADVEPTSGCSDGGPGHNLVDPRAQTLTGASLHTYKALVAASRPMSRRDIADVSGQGQETVRKALDSLGEQSLIVAAPDGPRSMKMFLAAPPRPVAALAMTRREHTVRQRVGQERTRFSADLAIRAIRQLAAGKVLDPHPATVVENLANERRSDATAKTLLSQHLYGELMDALGELYVRRAEAAVADEVDAQANPVLIYGAAPTTTPAGHSITTVARRIELRRSIRIALIGQARSLGKARHSPERVSVDQELLVWAGMAGPLEVLDDICGRLIATSPYVDIEEAAPEATVINLR